MSRDPITRPHESPAQFTELHNKLLELPRAECLNLLGRSHFGRLAVSRGEGAPIIRPLNYVFDPRSQSVVFRTAQGSKLHGLLRAREAAFEIDGIDAGGRTGWSVVILGVAEEVTNTSELRRLEKLGLEVWAPGPRTHWVRIRARTVSGRRIASVAAG
jgi:nitroimidazol reductase NimA-like FMN-containing flavoprotein (pyridoxamine 5'-phosphate oxidase superfamily)